MSTEVINTEATTTSATSAGAVAAGRVTARRTNDHVELVHADRPDIVLDVPRRDWPAFVEAVKAGALDLEVLNRAAQEHSA
ncbi:hypothetical protein [Nonomuraea pusilla]|uniref:DUF397 domain-containing protein n=1 Tax=Nonomuraea pusilla TaxID=46177 RepID=A0A1H7M7S9_9ACTN|nr:hypothetical protein [Nonomuraea pusilla]SEL06785.1 hypothetical protein SAMN05660976_01782 [Nonomuraea pusilla]